MDEGQTDNTISKVDCSNNTALPVVTADLAKLSIDINSSPTESTKRILRKRMPKSTAKTDVLNRRCSLKPKKRKVSEMDIEEENIKEYYLDKKINKKINLETIYEESDNAGDDIGMRMSAKRFKRMLLFSQTASKAKKRRAKVKKVFGSKIKHVVRGDIMKSYVTSIQILEKGPIMIDKELLEKIDKIGQSSSCV
ncbi:uncharacterized protein [Polyergus mexicanus]|uniref:uncharacterized protein isoform X1 n=1 Tax=Polyergus mexicanus TaxID=615972 RepID=UPI0038B49150